MIKLLTYINTALFIAGIGGLGYGWFNRDKITDSIMTEVQKQLPTLVKGAMPKLSVPSSTGNVLPF